MLFIGILERMQSLIEAHGYGSMPYYSDEKANELEQAMLFCQER